MNKRTFIKLSSAMMASPIISPLVGAMSEDKRKNWAGNLEYGTERLSSANSVEQVQEFVAKRNKLKVLGTRHCFNTIANSTDEFLSVRPMAKIAALDAAAPTVTVEGGMSYGQLCPELDSKGFALHNLASLPHITIAGACATATHGSGDRNGNLATAVHAIELVKADGETVIFSRDQQDGVMAGAVVGLGGLGVVTLITLNLIPTFQMSQYVYDNLPLAQLR